MYRGQNAGFFNLNKHDEEAAQKHNRLYYKSSALHEAFLQVFAPAVSDEDPNAG